MNPRKFIVVVTLPIIFFGLFAQAQSKVEAVQKEVTKACGKELGKDEALRMVKNLFLSCVPGDKVDVEGCKVNCLKENSGAVVGQ